jgi:hypothetical protein
MRQLRNCLPLTSTMQDPPLPRDAVSPKSSPEQGWHLPRREAMPGAMFAHRLGRGGDRAVWFSLYCWAASPR